MEKPLQLDWLAFVEEATLRRKSLKLTQEQLAVLAGVSKPTLNQFEIKLCTALKILTMLGLAPQEK